jgi:hypothetical protein
MPIMFMDGGQTYVSMGIRTGIMPPLLFARRYVLSQVLLNQRAARPPAVNAFHPTRRSATDMGRDLAKRIFGELKGAKVSTMLGQPEPIQPLADVAMTGPGNAEDIPVAEPMESTGGDVTVTATETMSCGTSSEIGRDVPVRPFPKPVAWDIPQSHANPVDADVPSTSVPTTTTTQRSPTLQPPQQQMTPQPPQQQMTPQPPQQQVRPQPPQQQMTPRQLQQQQSTDYIIRQGAL